MAAWEDAITTVVGFAAELAGEVGPEHGNARLKPGLATSQSG